MNSSRRRSRIAFGLVALLGLVLGLWAGVPQLAEASWPSAWACAVGLGLMLMGLFANAMSWGRLGVPPDRRCDLFRAFLLAHPAKYLPIGVVAQATLQVGMSVSSERRPMELTARFAVHAVIQAIGAGIVGGLAAFWVSGALWIGMAILAAAGGLFVLMLLTPSMVLQWVGRLLQRRLDGAIPVGHSMLAQSLVWAMVPAIAAGTTLSIIGGINYSEAVFAFAVAWLGGYLAIMVPTGIGIREGILVAMLSLPAAPVVALSLILRVLALGAEAIGYVGAVVWPRGNTETEQVFD